MSIRIVTDSTCDLPPSLVAQCGMAVVPCYINLSGRSLRDGIDLSREKFYEQLDTLTPSPTTAAPGMGAFLEVYDQLAAEGATAILSIHVASQLSNVANVARLAADNETRVPVYVIDGGQITLGTGLLALHAAQAVAAGHSLEAIRASVEERAARTYAFAALETLEFLRRSGRVSNLQFGVGTLLQVKPILKMHRGQVVMERVRTNRRALDRLVALAKELGPLESVSLVHAHAPERLQALYERARPLFPAGETPIVGEVTPVIGIHVGPGSVGIVCTTARSAGSPSRPKQGGTGS